MAKKYIVEVARFCGEMSQENNQLAIIGGGWIRRVVGYQFFKRLFGWLWGEIKKIAKYIFKKLRLHTFKGLNFYFRALSF